MVFFFSVYLEFSLCHRLVERQGDPHAPALVRVQDPAQGKKSGYKGKACTISRNPD